MPDWFFDWSDWIFGVLAAVTGVAVWLGWSRSRTRNVIEDGSHNKQQGGTGKTDNLVARGDHNDQSGS
jgi:hypothetical protein